MTRSVMLAIAAALAAPVAAAPPKAKITPRHAEIAAVKKIPGKAQSAKYEFEEGRWQYAVLVKDKTGQLYEVEVNATTGRVMDSEKTSAAEEAQEAAQDARATKKRH